jgi:hypothetical protein
VKINSVSKPVLFTDDTIVIISSRNFTGFLSVSNLVPSHIVKLFAANKLVLNLNETNVITFITTNSSQSTLWIGFNRKVYRRGGK